MDDKSLTEWLDSLASKTPAPGGGAVAALLATTAAALLEMVSVYTTGEKWADREDRMKQLNNQAGNLRHQALRLVKDDEAAFAAVASAYKLPAESSEEKAAKNTAVQTALEIAAKPPADVVKLTSSIIEIAHELAESANPNVVSDVAVASATASAALQSAVINIEINAASISDNEIKDRLLSSITHALELKNQADKITESVRSRW